MIISRASARESLCPPRAERCRDVEIRHVCPCAEGRECHIPGLSRGPARSLRPHGTSAGIRSDTGVATPISYAPLEHKYRVTTAAACWTFIAVAAVPFGCDQSPVQGVHTLPPAAYMSALREPRDDAAEQE